MIKHITRLLLLTELGCALLIGLLLKHWYGLDTGIALLYGFLVVFGFRVAILLYGFAITYPYHFRQPNAPKLGFLKTARMIAIECMAALYSTSWTMPFRRFDKHITPGLTTLPVLLLHGYVCNSGFWRPMTRVLRKNGINHYAIDIEPVFGSIDQTTAQVHAAVERILSECGQSHVVIVAHSMGGLVARAYLRDYGTHRTAKVITLGTPHHGTTVANRGLGINCKEMLGIYDQQQLVDSDWLQKLSVCEYKSTRELFVSIYTTHDNVIYPQVSSYLEGATNVAVSGTGHMALTLEADVTQRIVAEVRSATPLMHEKIR